MFFDVGDLRTKTQKENVFIEMKTLNMGVTKYA
jgi:hypothetical protein